MLVAESNSAAEPWRENSGSCITKIFIKLLRYSIDYINLCTNKLIALIYIIQGLTEKYLVADSDDNLNFFDHEQSQLQALCLEHQSLPRQFLDSTQTCVWAHVRQNRFLKHSNFHKHQRMHDVEFLEKNIFSFFAMRNSGHTRKLGLKSDFKNYLIIFHLSHI